jgi:CO dehydrogenase/acetyl-CoA synthase gamma subunit (corrinoid Fe-S protein)
MLKTNFLGRYQAQLEEIVESGRFIAPTDEVKKEETPLKVIIDPELKALWTLADEKEQEAVQKGKDLILFCSHSSAFRETDEGFDILDDNHSDVQSVKKIQNQINHLKNEEKFFRKMFWFMVRTDETCDVNSLGMRKEWQVVESECNCPVCTFHRLME